MIPGRRSASRGSSMRALARSWSMFSSVMRNRRGALWVRKVRVPSGLASTTVSPCQAGRRDMPVSTGPTCVVTVPLRKIPSHAPTAATKRTTTAFAARDRRMTFDLCTNFIQILAYLNDGAEWQV
ncbi:hypothetical protein GCM10020001_038770 [Nonomuraea salmonea]